MADNIVSMFQAAGLKAGKQKYSYQAAGEVFAGENAYAILHAPRGDATESMVLCAALKNMDGKLNDGGVGLVLALSRYLKSMFCTISYFINTSLLGSVLSN